MKAAELLKQYPDADREVVEHGHERIGDMTRADLYVQSRQRGNDDKFAAMCAMRRVPGAMTDDVFWAGRKHFSEVYGESYAQDVKNRLAAQGVTMSAHDEYLPEMAQYRGDPRAVVNRANGRGYIAKLAEMNGAGCEGAVNVAPRQPLVDPLSVAPKLGEDIVQEEVGNILKKEPRRNKREAREEVIARHGSK